MLDRLDGKDMLFKMAIPVLGDDSRFEKLDEELLEATAAANVFFMLRTSELRDELIRELADVYVTTMAYIAGDAHRQHVFWGKVDVGMERLANAMRCVDSTGVK